MYQQKNRKWLSYSLIFALLFTLVFPAMGMGAEDKQVQSILNSNLVSWPNSTDATPFDHSKKLEALDALKQNPSERASTRFKAEQVEAGDGFSAQMLEPANYVPASDSKELISVIVELQSEPIAAYQAKVHQGLMRSDTMHQKKLAVEQDQFATAAKKLNVKLDKQYKHVFNGYSLQIPANQVEDLLDLPGVKAIYENIIVHATPIDSITPNMNISAPHIGSNYYWDLGFDGTGIKVGVLDTGIDYNHPSLAEAYKGGYDFVDNDDDPMETPPNPNDPEAETSHGTHVAGTVGGRGNPDDPNSESGWVRGVAPGSDIYAYRVLGPGGTGTTSNIIAAVERSYEDGMDVINLSLGASVNNQFDALSVALNNSMLAGVITVTSNGNSGPDDYTVGVPGTAEMAISVGASSPPLHVPIILGTGLEKVFASMMTYSPDLGELKGQPLEIVYAGLGTEEDFEGIDVTGKVALISRGSISFGEKSINARNAGAAVAIIHNNEPGNFGGTLGEPGDHIPTMSISQEDGLELAANIEADTNYTITLDTELEQDLMAEFSSRGPSLPGLAIKPDISAPGVAIRSSVPSFDGNYEDAYASMQGTSMASPHIAGAAALLLQKDASLTPFEVKSVMMNNAYKLSDRDHSRYSHMTQGAGRVDLEQTINATAIAMVEEVTTATNDGNATPYYTGSISFGLKNTGAQDSRNIKLKDIANANSTYSVTTTWYGPAAGNLTVSENQVTVNAGDTAEFQVGLAVADHTPDGRYEGEVILTEASGHTLQIPVSLFVGSADIPDPVSDITLDPIFFSPNNDGVTDTTDIRFKVNSDVDYFSLDVYSIDTESNRYVWEGTIIETEDGVSPGSYIIRGWDGSVANYNEVFDLDENLYLVLPWVEDAQGYRPLLDQDYPFVLDVTAPVSTLNDPPMTVEGSTGVITGQIVSDFMIDLFGDYSAIGVAALYNDQGWKQINGTIDDNGAFRIQVPIQAGLNVFEIYVYDIADNGVLEPAHIVEYTGEEEPPKESGISAVASKSAVEPGEAFEIAVNFAELEDVYSTQFSLTYDGNLTEGSITPSVTLAAYQQEQNPGTSLIVNENKTELENGLTQLDYIVSLVGDINGYTGSGTLATLNFSSANEGTFHFDLSNVRLLDSEANDINFGPVTNATVTVTEKDPVEQYTITGNINAEAFGSGVNYSETWYEGADGVHKVVVEAVNSSGSVAGVAQVNADGSYAITVSEQGTYTVRVVVPGHIGKSASVTVDQNVTQNFSLTAGDVNQDGKVDLVDLQLAAKEFGKVKGSAWPNAKASAADINRDGVIDLLDVSYILNNITLQR